MRTGWLKCEIQEGMFTDEVAITVKDSGGREVSGFVHSQKVNPEASRVEVEILDGGLAVLPTCFRDLILYAESDLAVTAA